MRAKSVRIVAPIPGRAAVGIEIPNQRRELIFLSEVINSEHFRQPDLRIPLALGKDIAGSPYVADLAAMPHLLIAGATGSGKSVTLNAIILSLLYNFTPRDVRLVMLDPKMVELGIYNGIPHLLAPVVIDPKQAPGVLRWATNTMEERYQRLARFGVRNVEQYNRLVSSGAAGEEAEYLPYIVLVIDEFADLMIVSSKEVEMLVTRLAQMARAVGIHLIIATQRPSVDVITGLIKANFPARISFRVASRVDSRTILASIGAEKLLGMGDMLFMPPAAADLVRIHGAFVSEREVKRVVDFWVKQGQPDYDPGVLEQESAGEYSGEAGEEDLDEVYAQAVEFVKQRGEASISLIQRRFRIGYNRAARIIEAMEREGLLGPVEAAGKPRKVLVSGE